MPLKIVLFTIVISAAALGAVRAEEEAAATADQTAAASEPGIVAPDPAKPIVEAVVEAPVAVEAPVVAEAPPAPPMPVALPLGAGMSADEKEKLRADIKARREAWIKEHPEELKQMRENMLKRQQWMREHPEEAQRQKEAMMAELAARRAKMMAERTSR